MKERQFHIHPGERDEVVCQLDGISMADNVIRVKDGKSVCALCGVELELWEQRRVNQQEDGK